MWWLRGLPPCHIGNFGTSAWLGKFAFPTSNLGSNITSDARIPGCQAKPRLRTRYTKTKQKSGQKRNKPDAIGDRWKLIQGGRIGASGSRKLASIDGLKPEWLNLVSDARRYCMYLPSDRYESIQRRIGPHPVHHRYARRKSAREVAVVERCPPIR
ncbi:hypothetical protein AG1IA_08466 [Rhizoctonia solani AG-1 IA]|uniref:Uncharacterized protein n=1 Tax=Thanatephorus cucumeris (strain AG1-IA) TaxID=983506 RepID=L8WL90_THACA|nr:hypothetical protein AG1IA_08466 [Rhizoctonia solani AG-1 IA]